MSVHNVSHIIISIAEYVVSQIRNVCINEMQMQKLITGLCMDHSEDFFNQNIEQIRGSENENKKFDQTDG
jgi:hypothetical protein